MGTYLLRHTTDTDTENNYEFTIKPPRPIELDPEREWSIALKNGYSYYAVQNLTTGGNLLQYSPDSGTTFYNVSISAGLWTHTTLQSTLESVMYDASHWDTTNNAAYIFIEPNLATGKFKIRRTSAAYSLKFHDALATLFGAADDTAIGSGDLPNAPEIDSGKNAVIVSCDLVRSGFSITSSGYNDSLYSKTITVGPYEQISFENSAGFGAVAVPCRSGSIDSVKVRITDQDGNPWDTPGYESFVEFIIRARD